MKLRGPALVFATWALHDVEEALAFPSTSDELAHVTGIESLRIDGRQSWTAVGIMGVFVATACFLGQKTEGRSRLYRAVLAGLEGHVYTHLVASAARRGYTAGVATAVPVMLPGAIAARRELRRAGAPLQIRDYIRGAILLIPAAALSHVLARLIPTSPRR